MSRYIKEWPCCGDETKTDAWIPESCPFCGLLAAEHENEQLRERVAELVAVAVSVRDDLLLRSEIDSDGTRCVNLSASKWNSFCDVIDENNSGAFILRRQAEAVESAMENEMAEFRLHNGTSRSGCFAQDLAAYAQRLRNKAEMESEQ